jgi:Transposase, Mutator family
MTCSLYCFPAAHRSKLRSTNPLERVNRDIGRRTDVVGIFPNDAALIRLAGALLIEQNDDWLVTRRYLSEDSMAELLTTGTSDEDEIEKELRSRKGVASRIDGRVDERGPRTPLDATQLFSVDGGTPPTVSRCEPGAGYVGDLCGCHQSPRRERDPAAVN